MDGGRGALFETEAELVAELNLLAQIKKTGKSIQHQAISESAKRYSWEKLCAKYVAIYNSALVSRKLTD